VRGSTAAVTLSADSLLILPLFICRRRGTSLMDGCSGDSSILGD
jgi:hypothetical protein